MHHLNFFEHPLKEQGMKGMTMPILNNIECIQFNI